jgi:DNA-binding MarR family transcriptional regulator
VPLVTVESGSDTIDRRARRIAITDAGREVLAARADQIRLNGIDVWRGGVHLAGSDASPWRWDAHHERLVS